MEGGACGRKQKLQYTLCINIAALECSFSEKMRDTTLNVNNIKTKKSILLTIVCQIEWFSRYKCEYNQRWRKLLLSYLCGLASIWIPLTISRTVGNTTCWFIALMTPWTFANTQIVNSLYFVQYIFKRLCCKVHRFLLNKTQQWEMTVSSEEYIQGRRGLPDNLACS